MLGVSFIFYIFISIENKIVEFCLWNDLWIFSVFVKGKKFSEIAKFLQCSTKLIKKDGGLDFKNSCFVAKHLSYELPLTRNMFCCDCKE